MKHAPHSTTGNTLPATPPGGLTAGLDWAKDDHVVAIVESAGQVSDRFTITHTGVGLAELAKRLGKLGVTEIAIERPDGPVVTALLEAGLTVVVISPNQLKNLRSRYGSAGPRPEGTVMTVSFELDGQRFVALNGGPEFTFNEAISFQVSCETQEEVDAFWSTLSEGGEEGPCGWLKDRFGVSWQIVPTVLPELLGDPDREKSQRVMQAMLNMKKIEIDALERAATPA